MSATIKPEALDAFSVPPYPEEDPRDIEAMREYFRRNPLDLHAEDCAGGCGGACLMRAE